MKHLYIFCVVLFFSCNQAPKKEIDGVPYNPADYQMTQTFTVYEASYDTTKIIMTAKDGSNSWLCNFYADRLYLLTNNLKDTFTLTHDLSYSIKNKNLLYPNNFRTKDSSFIFEIFPETCKGETDDDVIFSNVPKKLRIKFNNKIYSGCITLIDTTLK